MWLIPQRTHLQLMMYGNCISQIRFSQANIPLSICQVQIVMASHPRRIPFDRCGALMGSSALTSNGNCYVTFESECELESASQMHHITSVIQPALHRLSQSDCMHCWLPCAHRIVAGHVNVQCVYWNAIDWATIARWLPYMTSIRLVNNCIN